MLRGRPHWVTARRREIDTVLVWRLDRWGTVSGRPVVALQELERLGVGFVSLTEALNLTTPRVPSRGGRANPVAAIFGSVNAAQVHARAVQGRLGLDEPLNRPNGHAGLLDRDFSLLKAAL